MVGIKSMGNEGGAANLIICEILLMHINEKILNEQQHIDPHKIDLVARMGDEYYCRASGSAVFEVLRPKSKPAIGIDQLPGSVRDSKVLSGNNLGMLGNSEHFQRPEELASVDIGDSLSELYQRLKNDPESLEYHKHLLAKRIS